MDRDWDTAIILDACRYDTFINCLPDEWPKPEKIQSRAGNTWDFYGENFNNPPYSDTVVVTANPRTVQRCGDIFHEVIPVYEDHWDEETGTVLPDVMAEQTNAVHDRYPNKRILSHWIQPHYPFIGSDLLDGYEFDEEPVWEDLKRGKIDTKTVYRAYEETLEATLPHVDDVLSAVEGKCVVTSDHGNAFGEHPWWYPLPLYGHPRGVRHWSVIDVPWMVYDSGERRAINKGTIQNKEYDRDIEDRLKALGYTD